MRRQSCLTRTPGGMPATAPTTCTGCNCHYGETCAFIGGCVVNDPGYGQGRPTPASTEEQMTAAGLAVHLLCVWVLVSVAGCVAAYVATRAFQ